MPGTWGHTSPPQSRSDYTQIARQKLPSRLAFTKTSEKSITAAVLIALENYVALVDLGVMGSTKYDAKNNNASVGSGARRWMYMLISDPSTGPAKFKATKNFKEKTENRPDSLNVLLWHYESSIDGTVITRIMANTRSIGKPPELEETMTIPTISGSLSKTMLIDFQRNCIQSYGWILGSLSVLAPDTCIDNSSKFWFTCIVQNNPTILQKAVYLHDESVTKLKNSSKMGNFTKLQLFKAMSTIYVAKMAAMSLSSTTWMRTSPLTSRCMQIVSGV
ncbi:uncharacterized protein BCR38DRAFT_410808 [Pseudomassariella vexata]|uniref:Uncharacterized protein n=1 Tax=Pseudomassariella vexata TaxID=1141098 RepID=A0A1Y2DSY3_9PEZI|nr:uncharacterized protein BCR38DRAFT_410808 [Pseudomassariella vexata]ORY62388.1 hypothetical protein BCR38DRAFT_410808 [Pseudomassariella vexata]